MQLLKPEPDHSPTSIAKKYGSAKLELSRHSACSLEKFPFSLHIKTGTLFYILHRAYTNILTTDTVFMNS